MRLGGIPSAAAYKDVLVNNLTITNMKTMNTLLLAGTVALSFTLTSSTKADKPLLSPKAAALRHDFRSVPSTETSPILVLNNYLGAAGKLELNRAKISPSSPETRNLVSGNYLGAGAKNPFPKSASFEIAPLVLKDKPGKTCEAGCTMPCCAKK